MDDTSAFEQIGQEFLFCYGAKGFPLENQAGRVCAYVGKGKVHQPSLD